MRLIVFEKDGGRALGIRDGEELIDVAAAGVDAPTDISEVLQAGPELLDRLRALPSRALNSARLSCAGLKHKPLALRFPKAICLGLNYLDHAAEAGFSKPEYPTIFHWAPQSSCLHAAGLDRLVGAWLWRSLLHFRARTLWQLRQ